MYCKLCENFSSFFSKIRKRRMTHFSVLFPSFFRNSRFFLYCFCPLSRVLDFSINLFCTIYSALFYSTLLVVLSVSELLSLLSTDIIFSTIELPTSYTILESLSCTYRLSPFSFPTYTVQVFLSPEVLSL